MAPEKQHDAEMAEHHEEPSLPLPVMEEESGVPPGYWTSFRFLGSIAAITLLANNLFIGYSMPVREHGLSGAPQG